jgi:hypothetical protein
MNHDNSEQHSLCIWIEASKLRECALMAHQPQTIKAGNNRCRSCSNALDVPTTAKRQLKKQTLLVWDLMIQPLQNIRFVATIAANMYLLCMPSQQLQHDNTEQQSLLVWGCALQQWQRALMARQPQTIRAGNNRCRKCLNALDVQTIAKRQLKKQTLLVWDLMIQPSQTIRVVATIAANMCLPCLPSQQPQQDSTEQQSLLLWSEAWRPINCKTSAEATNAACLCGWCSSNRRTSACGQQSLPTCICWDCQANNCSMATQSNNRCSFDLKHRNCENVLWWPINRKPSKQAATAAVYAQTCLTFQQPQNVSSRNKRSLSETRWSNNRRTPWSGQQSLPTCNCCACQANNRSMPALSNNRCSFQAKHPTATNMSDVPSTAKHQKRATTAANAVPMRMTSHQSQNVSGSNNRCLFDCQADNCSMSRTEQQSLLVRLDATQ